MKSRQVNIQNCDECGGPYIDKAKHDQSCPAKNQRGLRELCDKCGAFYFHLEGHACAAEAEKPEAASIIIPRQHQSAPKEHPAAKAIKEAAQEIVDGKFVPKFGADDFFHYGETHTVAFHPRVQETMAKLEEQARDTHLNTQEMLEKAHAYHELNERASQSNQWDGQGRWIGKENEEMRHGQILSPFQFMEQLRTVTGTRPIELNNFAVLNRVAILVPDPDYKPRPRPNTGTEDSIEILRRFAHKIDATLDIRKQLQELEAAERAMQLTNSGQAEHLRGKMQAATLQYPLGTEWMIMRFDDYGVPVEPKFLGWRTALLSLITLRVITEKEAHAAFPVGSGPAAAWYLQQLQMLRSQGVIPA